MKTKTVTMNLNDDIEIICDILFTYHSDNFNNDYAIFKDRETNRISAFSYTLNDEDEIDQVLPIKTEIEWEMLEKIATDYINSMSGGCSCGGGSCGGCQGDCDCGCECECDGCD